MITPTQGANVADIISLKEKRQSSDEKQEALDRKHKILAVQKIFHCTHCASKCEKCGTQIGMQMSPCKQKLFELRVPYRFCESCSEEYIDYIEHLKGGGNPKNYWHNDAWLELWKAWIDYQFTIDRYLKSKEFKRLVDELKHTGPDQ